MKLFNKLYMMIIAEPIDIGSCLQRFADPRTGACVWFAGMVRNISHQQNVAYLEYEAFVPLANTMISDIVAQAVKQFNLLDALCLHRTGRLVIGETAVLVVTASMHRKEAYAANQYIIDRVKHEAPVWKKEYWADGSYTWGHCL